MPQRAGRARGGAGHADELAGRRRHRRAGGAGRDIETQGRRGLRGGRGAGSEVAGLGDRAHGGRGGGHVAARRARHLRGRGRGVDEVPDRGRRLRAGAGDADVVADAGGNLRGRAGQRHEITQARRGAGAAVVPIAGQAGIACHCRRRQHGKHGQRQRLARAPGEAARRHGFPLYAVAHCEHPPRRRPACRTNRRTQRLRSRS